METTGARDGIQAFVEGFFGVLDALLASSVRPTVDSLEAADAEGLTQALAQFPVVMEATVGAAVPVVLLEVKDALTLAGMVFGSSGKAADRLAEHDLATLKELSGHALKGAVARLAARTGRDLRLGEVRTGLSNPLTVQRLLPVLEGRSRLVRVSFTAPDLHGRAVFVLPDELLPAAEAAAGPGATAAAAPETNEGPPRADAPDFANPEDLGAVFAQLDPRKELGMTPDADIAALRGPGGGRETAGNLDMILDIRLVVRARLGRVEMPIGDILALGPGSIVEVGRMLDEPVDLLVNDKLIARGDVVVVDEKFGLRITEIISPRERIESLR